MTMNKKKLEENKELNELFQIFMKYEFENWMHDLEIQFGERIAMQHCSPENFEKYVNSWSDQKLQARFKHFIAIFEKSLDKAETILDQKSES